MPYEHRVKSDKPRKRRSWKKPRTVWTPERSAELMRLRAAGKTFAAAARIMGMRRNQLISHYHQAKIEIETPQAQILTKEMRAAYAAEATLPKAEREALRAARQEKEKLNAVAL